MVKLKALSPLNGTEASAVINHLEAAGLQTGPLLDFSRPTVEYKRLLHSKKTWPTAPLTL
jgi:hypothetical protein